MPVEKINKYFSLDWIIIVTMRQWYENGEIAMRGKSSSKKCKSAALKNL